MASNYTLTMDTILKESRIRWLKGFEVLWVLQNYQQFGLQLSTAPPTTAPSSGSLFLYNKRSVKFKKDNINWKKQKDGKGVKESHERLKVGGVRAISCSYATAEDDENFHRRTYWLIDGDTNTVLVHYLNDAVVTIVEERPSPTPINVPLNFGNNVFIPQNFTAFPYPQQPQQQQPMFTPTFTPMTAPSTPQTFQSNFGKPFSYQATFEPPAPPTQVFSPSLLLGNEEWSEDDIERDADALSDLTSLDETSIMMMKHFDDEARNLEEVRPIEETRASPSVRISKLARITDFSPEWDFTEGGAKVLVTSPEFVPGHDYYCLFDNTEVAGDLIQPGVIRCIVPPHIVPGYVSFCITLGNFMMFSEVKQFEYRKSKHENELLSMTERNFKVRIVDRLEKLVYAMNSVAKVNTSTNEHEQAQIIEQVILKILSTLLVLLPFKSTIDLQDEDGISLLHCACALGYSTVALKLIDFGADVNIKDKFGLTPFHWAVKKGDERLVNLLAELTDLDSVAIHVESEEMDRLMAAFSEIELEDFKQTIKEAYTQDLSLERAATRIQSLYRGHKAREEARRQRELQEIQKDAARKILSAYRKHRQRFWSKLEATAVIIQTRMRAKWAQRKKEKENEAAKKIQNAFKRYRQKSFVHM